MTESRRDKLDDDRAREWLEKHAPMRALKPKPKLQRRERWQMRKQEQKREQLALKKPLLKSVEMTTDHQQQPNIDSIRDPAPEQATDRHTGCGDCIA